MCARDWVLLWMAALACLLSNVSSATTLVAAMTYEGEISNGNCQIEDQTLNFGKVSEPNVVAHRVARDFGIAIHCDGLSFPSAISFSSAVPGDDFGTDKQSGLVVKLQTGSIGLASYDKQRVTNGSSFSLEALGAETSYLLPLRATLAPLERGSGVAFGAFDIPVTVNFTY